MPLTLRHHARIIAIAAFTLLSAAAALAEDSGKASEGFMRVAGEADQWTALELATRTYKRAGGDGPTVSLVGIAHVGDAVLYDSIGEWLAAWDLVLYESVLPAGARGPRGDTEEERIESTRAALGFVASLVVTAEHRDGAFPESLEALGSFAEGLDSRFHAWLGNAQIDAWGHPVVYKVAADKADFTLSSLGADGEPGGSGAAADIELTSESGGDPLTLSSEDGIQAELAKALGLEFQLTSLSYDHSNWVCSDMAMDEVEREMSKRGADFGMLKGTLSGSSLSGDMLKQLVKLLPMVDAMMGGGMADTFKVLMIEMLADESMTTTAMDQQFGKGFGEVIIGERNQVVIDDLVALLARDDCPESIAILYGAAHMPDMEARMKQLGYERSQVFWIPAIRVDLTKSAMSSSQIKMIRNMMKGMGKKRAR